LDKKIRGGDKINKKQKKSKPTDGSEKTTILESMREDVVKCIGDICFTPEGKIVVKVDKDKSPECAKLAADYVLAGSEVIFEVTRTVGVRTEDNDMRVGKELFKEKAQTLKR